jgi:hypothetical protein
MADSTRQNETTDIDPDNFGQSLHSGNLVVAVTYRRYGEATF